MYFFLVKINIYVTLRHIPRYFWHIHMHVGIVCGTDMEVLETTIIEVHPGPMPHKSHNKKETIHYSHRL